MKLFTKRLLLNISMLVCVQPAAALTLPSWTKKQGPLAIASIVGGYTACKVASHYLPSLFKNKELKDDDSLQMRADKTLYNEKVVGTIRTAIKICGPELLEAQLHKYKLGSKLNSFLLVNSFNVWNALSTVFGKEKKEEKKSEKKEEKKSEKTEEQKSEKTEEQKPTFYDWSFNKIKSIGKTTLYVGAGILQTKIPELLDKEWKPVAKLASRSVTTAILNWLFNTNKDEYNEAIKDLVDFGMKGLPLTYGKPSDLF